MMADSMVETGYPEIRLTFGGMARESIEDAARAVMVGLSEHAEVLDPVVTADAGRGELSVSFELISATRDAARDVTRAIEVFSEALRASRGGVLPIDATQSIALTRPRHVEYALAG
jgi:hypothetical protein